MPITAVGGDAVELPRIFICRIIPGFRVFFGKRPARLTKNLSDGATRADNSSRTAMDDRKPVAVDTLQPPDLSIVTTLYRSRQFIERFYREACRVTDSLGLTFEIVLVNDGSPDDSLDVALALHKRDGRVKLVDLSRNFGHHRALMTAFAYASADLVYVTDVDLEEPMDFLRTCHERFQQGDCDVVYGYQERRRGNWLTRATGEAFWKLFNFLCSTKLPRNLVTARLMSKRYVESLLEHGEHDPFVPGLWASTGYDQIGLPIVKQLGGSSSYSTFRRVSLALNSIVSFSSRPLLLSAGLGIFICFIASLCVIYLVGQWLILGNPVEGWTSLTVSVWFMGGANLFFIGLTGLYISKIFNEVKQRPNVIVRAVYDGSPRNPGRRAASQTTPARAI
jgi:putative glycosyltransferase